MKPPADAAAAVYADMHRSFTRLAANGIRRSALDEFAAFLAAPGTLARPSLILRCRIAAGGYRIEVVVDKPISRPRVATCFEPFLARALPAVRGDADFFLLVSDKLHVAEDQRARCVEYLQHIPLLRCDRSRVDELSTHSPLIPDYFMQDPAYGEDLVSIERARRDRRFDDRTEVVNWRGRLNGEDYANLDNYRDFPRYRLAAMSLVHAEIDARLIDYEFGDRDPDRALGRRLHAELGPPGEWISAAGFVQFKYLISLDGVGAAWKRVATLLATGSVVLLHHRWSQFFYPGLEAWVHYIPVRYDLSDVVERYEWLRSHPAEARRIAGNGLRFAREVLHPRSLEAYFAAVVNMCSEASVSG